MANSLIFEKEVFSDFMLVINSGKIEEIKFAPSLVFMCGLDC